MIKRAYSLAREIARDHVKRVGTNNIAVNSEAIARLIASELVKAQEEGIANEREECAMIAEAKQSALNTSAYQDEVGVRVEDLNRAQTACEIAFEIRARSLQDSATAPEAEYPDTTRI